MPSVKKPKSARPATAKTKALTKTKKNALGRGLSALIPVGEMTSLDKNEATPELQEGEAILQVTLDQIIANPAQPRRSFPQQELDELADSIREHGVLQPVLLRPIGDSTGQKYEIVAGERRWRAAQVAKLKTIPAIVRHMEDQQALELAIIENVQRQDISALDAAIAYRRLQHEFGLSQEAIADRVAKSRAAIANTLRLLDLPDEVQAAISEDKISEGHGRAILGAKAPDARKAILRRVLRDHLTVRQTEELARKSDVQGENAVKKPQKPQSADEKQIEEQLQRALGTRVQLKTKRRGGEIIISYFSIDELEGILEHFGA